MDTRYTTTQQVVKLIGSHTISKVTVKIGDLKRTKMVRTINLYYNNRTVQAIVELKNKYVLLRFDSGVRIFFLAKSTKETIQILGFQNLEFGLCLHNLCAQIQLKQMTYLFFEDQY